MTQIDYYWETLVKYASLYIPKVLLAIIVLIVGWLLIKKILKLTDKAFEKREVEATIRSFFRAIINVVLKILLILSVIAMVGIETTSFVAVLAAASFSVGLALQGSLSNFAGGVLILIFKPFKTGDYIDAQGYSGSVKNIQIFNTILKTPDNKTISVPNGFLSNSPIINYTTEPKRRLDLVFGIGYEDDIEKAKSLIEKVAKEDDRIDAEPAPLIAVGELGGSSINIYSRFWCYGSEYWNIFFEIQEKIKKTFDENGISIPFPQQDVHLYNSNK